MDTNGATNVIKVPISKITPDPANLREYFEDNDIETLGQNLLEHGQLDPIQVFERDDGNYDLYDGERRWRGAKQVGLKALNAIVVARPSPADLVCKKVSRALQTRNLTPQEEVDALEKALSALNVHDRPDQWSGVAKRLGISQQLLRDRMRITQLADPVRSEFETGQLDLSAAQALGRLDDKARQVEVAEFIDKNQLHTRFVGTKFIEKLVKHPDEPVEEVYTIAQSELRTGTPVSKTSTVPELLAGRLEDMLADLRRSETWLEAAGREGLLNQLSGKGDSRGRTRLVEGIGRLGAMCRSFLSFVDAEPGDKDPSRVPKLGSGTRSS